MEGWLDSSRRAVEDDPSSSLDFTMGQVCHIIGVRRMGDTLVCIEALLVSVPLYYVNVKYLFTCTDTRMYGV